MNEETIILKDEDENDYEDIDMAWILFSMFLKIYIIGSIIYL